MTLLCSLLDSTKLSRRTDGQTDGRYQVNYHPALLRYAVDNDVFLTGLQLITMRQDFIRFAKMLLDLYA